MTCEMRQTIDSLEKALLDVREAENLIAQSPRDPSVYKGSVKEAMAKLHG